MNSTSMTVVRSRSSCGVMTCAISSPPEMNPTPSGPFWSRSSPSEMTHRIRPAVVDTAVVGPSATGAP
jgi:hypothetical protein